MNLELDLYTSIFSCSTVQCVFLSLLIDFISLPVPDPGTILSSLHASQYICLVKIVPTDIQTVSLANVRSAAVGAIWKKN